MRRDDYRRIGFVVASSHADSRNLAVLDGLVLWDQASRLSTTWVSPGHPVPSARCDADQAEGEE